MSAARPPLFVVFRPMVEADDEASATDAADAVRSAVARVPGVARTETAQEPRPYWKIEGTWEFTLHLHPTGAVADVFASILALAPGGAWTGTLPGDPPSADGDIDSDGSLWAVWNPPADAATGDRLPGAAPLVVPAVVWAELCTWDGVVYDESRDGPFEDADR